MIVNNLRENKVNLLADLHGVASPVLSMRASEYVIPYGGKLVLNYYVCDYFGAEYPNADGSVTVGKPSTSSFTFVARIDEDTVELDVVKEYKQTTLSGEQTMEIDLTGMSAGVHSVIVQAISNGMSSPVEWLKFRIMDENEETDLASHTMDLSSMSNNESFTSRFKNLGGNSEEIPPDNSSKKYVLASTYIDTSDKDRVAERVIVADYTVTKKSSSEIEIVVGAGSRIYYTFVNSWFGYYRGSNPGDMGEPVHYTRVVEDISGTYKLTNSVTVNGTTKTLTEYLSCSPNDIPDVVVKTAMKNKVALTRLCEAVQAYYYGDSITAGKFKLKLPQEMDIVVDYHGFAYVNDGGNKRLDYDVILTWLWGDEETQDKLEMERAFAKFPDRFVLDLNGSVVSVLPTNNVESGPFLVIGDCYDTHIINGEVHGEYLSRKYYENSLAESLCNIKILSSEFCSFENINDKYSTGYDGECDGRRWINWGTWKYARNRVNRVIFNEQGYIDVDGTIHKSETVVDDRVFALRYTKGVDDGSTGTSASFIDNSLLHKIINADGVPTYHGRREIQSEVKLLRGAHFWCTRPDPHNVSGDDAYWGQGGLYIYFYKEFDANSEAYQRWLDDPEHNEPLEFIKAYKIRMTMPVLVPKGAKYAHMCAFGLYNANQWVGLKNSTDADSLSRMHFNESQSSWVCGYKNCSFSHGRTSILNWHWAYQCYMKNIRTFLLGAGRAKTFGGMSNQTYNIDTEDDSYACGFMSLDNVECIAGNFGAKIHHPIEFCFNQMRGYSFDLGKNVFLGVLRNSYNKVKNYIGYSHPTKFLRFVNNVITSLEFSFSVRGSSSGIMFIEDSNVLDRVPNDKTTVIEKDNIITQELEL